jgi:hypothetical protein
LESYPRATKGDRGHDWTTDVAIGGSPDPVRAVVVSSALHGVEGFAGSATQLAVLEHEARLWQPPEGVALVLVHALNPCGFAELRRTNEDNVDLNRSFVIPDANGTVAYQGCHPLYPRLDAVLNPRYPPRWYRPFLPHALLAMLRFRGSNRIALRQAIAGGQYEFPRGLFFGGKGPSWTQLLLQRHLPEWLGAAKHIVHFDIHTGLGPWGKLQLLLDQSLTAERRRWLADQFGAGVVSLPTASAAEAADYYTARGELGGFCQHLFRERVYDPICAEFGTYSALTVLTALRTENQAHHWAAPNAAVIGRARRRLREVFAPANLDWRRSVVRQGLDVVRRAFEIFRIDQTATAANA